jgi:hypothetical protein
MEGWVSRGVSSSPIFKHPICSARHATKHALIILAKLSFKDSPKGHKVVTFWTQS